MFDWLRKKRDERRREKARADFERAASETTIGSEANELRARDSPDELGEGIRRIGANPPPGI